MINKILFAVLMTILVHPSREAVIRLEEKPSTPAINNDIKRKGASLLDEFVALISPGNTKDGGDRNIQSRNAVNASSNSTLLSRSSNMTEENATNQNTTGNYSATGIKRSDAKEKELYGLLNKIVALILKAIGKVGSNKRTPAEYKISKNESANASVSTISELETTSHPQGLENATLSVTTHSTMANNGTTDAENTTQRMNNDTTNAENTTQRVNSADGAKVKYLEEARFDDSLNNINPGEGIEDGLISGNNLARSGFMDKYPSFDSRSSPLDKGLEEENLDADNVEHIVDMLANKREWGHSDTNKLTDDVNLDSGNLEDSSNKFSDFAFVPKKIRDASLDEDNSHAMAKNDDVESNLINQPMLDKLNNIYLEENKDRFVDDGGNKLSLDDYYLQDSALEEIEKETMKNKRYQGIPDTGEEFDEQLSPLKAVRKRKRTNKPSKENKPDQKIPDTDEEFDEQDMQTLEGTEKSKIKTEPSKENKPDQKIPNTDEDFDEDLSPSKGVVKIEIKNKPAKENKPHENTQDGDDDLDELDSSIEKKLDKRTMKNKPFADNNPCQEIPDTDDESDEQDLPPLKESKKSKIKNKRLKKNKPSPKIPDTDEESDDPDLHPLKGTEKSKIKKDTPFKEKKLEQNIPDTDVDAGEHDSSEENTMKNKPPRMIPDTVDDAQENQNVDNSILDEKNHKIRDSEIRNDKNGHRSKLCTPANFNRDGSKMDANSGTQTFLCSFTIEVKNGFPHPSKTGQVTHQVLNHDKKFGIKLLDILKKQGSKKIRLPLKDERLHRVREEPKVLNSTSGVKNALADNDTLGENYTQGEAYSQGNNHTQVDNNTQGDNNTEGDNYTPGDTSSDEGKGERNDKNEVPISEGDKQKPSEKDGVENSPPKKTLRRHHHPDHHEHHQHELKKVDKEVTGKHKPKNVSKHHRQTHNKYGNHPLGNKDTKVHSAHNRVGHKHGGKIRNRIGNNVEDETETGSKDVASEEKPSNSFNSNSDFDEMNNNAPFVEAEIHFRGGGRSAHFTKVGDAGEYIPEENEMKSDNGYRETRGDPDAKIEKKEDEDEVGFDKGEVEGEGFGGNQEKLERQNEELGETKHSRREGNEDQNSIEKNDDDP